MKQTIYLKTNKDEKNLPHHSIKIFKAFLSMKSSVDDHSINSILLQILYFLSICTTDLSMYLLQ